MAKQTKVAPSVFVTGPNDDVVAVDARGTTPKEVLAKSKITPQSPGLKALERIKNPDLNANDVAKMISLKGGAGIDKKEALGRIDNVLGQNVSGIFGQSPGLKEKAAGNLLGILTDGRYNGILGDTGELLEIGRGVDSNRATALMKAVKQFSNVGVIGDFVDNNAYVALGLGLLETAAEWGIIDAIDTIMGKLRAEKLAKARLVEGLRGAVLRGDIRMVNKILDLTSVEAALARMPNMIVLLLAGFRFAPKTPIEDYPGIKAELIALLVRVNPKWDVIVRNGVEIPDLAPFRTASQASRILLQLGNDERWRLQCLIGNKFRYQNLSDLARVQYPVLQAWLR